MRNRSVKQAYIEAKEVKMSYRGDFYTPENIIGYTGNVNNNPTVYFQNGTSFGHITQAHDLGPNVGREEVRQAQDYEIRNVNGKTQEWAGGRCIHPSRNAFISVANIDAASKYLLSTAISKFTEKKQWGDYTDVQQDQMLRYGRLINRNR